MIRLYLVGGLALAFSGLALYAMILASKLDAAQEALSLATEYISSTKGASDALNTSPDDPDAVLIELCRIAPGGPGCGNP